MPPGAFYVFPDVGGTGLDGATFARRVLEARGSLDWLKAQLGHSAITVTVDTYGHWSREAAQEEARRLSEALSA